MSRSSGTPVPHTGVPRTRGVSDTGKKEGDLVMGSTVLRDWFTGVPTKVPDKPGEKVQGGGFMSGVTSST